MPSRTQLAAMAAALTPPAIAGLTTERYSFDDLPGYPAVSVSTPAGRVTLRLHAGDRGTIETKGSVRVGQTRFDLRVTVECVGGRWRLAADSSDEFRRRAPLGVFFTAAPHRDVPETRARAVRAQVGGPVLAWLEAHPEVPAYAAQVRLLSELTHIARQPAELLPKLRELRAARADAIARGGCVEGPGALPAPVPALGPAPLRARTRR